MDPTNLCAADFRKTARESLRGYWGIAVIAGLVATLLGGISSSGGNVEYSQESGETARGLIGDFPQNAASFWSNLDNGTQTLIVVAVALGILISLAVAVALYILGSVVGTGYHKFNLDLTGQIQEPGMGTLFSYFPSWKTVAVARFLRELYVFLWSLLLIIPGIVASFSYAMTDFILAENPQLSASEALRQSKDMMEGQRWRYFCLQISFFGWALLCAFTWGIGNLWLTPYMQAANAAFYRDLRGTQHPAQSTP